MDYRLLISQISSKNLLLLSDEITRESLRRSDIKISIDKISNKSLSMEHKCLPPYKADIEDLFVRYGPCKSSLIGNKVIIDYDDDRDCSDVLKATNGVLNLTKILNGSLV